MLLYIESNVAEFVQKCKFIKFHPSTFYVQNTKSDSSENKKKSARQRKQDFATFFVMSIMITSLTLKIETD